MAEKDTKSKKKKIEDDKIAAIGDFVEPKEEGQEKENEKLPEGEEIPEEELKEQPTEISAEDLRERIIGLVSEIASRGLATDEEKAKFIDEFKFWNNSLFGLLNVGDNLKGMLEKAKIELSPGKALAIYILGTAALVVLLRKDLSTKLFKIKTQEKTPEATKPVSTTVTNQPEPLSKKIIEEGEEIEEIPKEAPTPPI